MSGCLKTVGRMLKEMENIGSHITESVLVKVAKKKFGFGGEWSKHQQIHPLDRLKRLKGQMRNGQL